MAVNDADDIRIAGSWRDCETCALVMQGIRPNRSKNPLQSVASEVASHRPRSFSFCFDDDQLHGRCLPGVDDSQVVHTWQRRGPMAQEYWFISAVEGCVTVSSCPICPVFGGGDRRRPVIAESLAVYPRENTAKPVAPGGRLFVCVIPPILRESVHLFWVVDALAGRCGRKHISQFPVPVVDCSGATWASLDKR